MKHILMLSTGGTIASEPTDHGLAPELSGNDLVSLIPELHGLCRISCREILNIDSSNMQPEHWMQIAAEIASSLDDYDGIVITHGTDTMAYTAAALSFMLQHLPKPVILTGSQLSITEDGTDARRNILDAFRTAVSGIPGVFIVFYGKILSGTRAKKMYTKDFDAFHSINADDIGHIDADGTVTIRQTGRQTGEFHPDIILNPNVCTITLLPGTRPDLFDAVIDFGYDGIILEAFGCGGIPNQERSLLPCIKKALEKGVTIVIASQCPYESVDLTIYDVNVQAARLGVISGLDMTREVLSVKLMWVLAHTTEPAKVRAMMHTCYAGELTE